LFLYFKIRAKSRSTPNIEVYANLTINIANSNEFKPKFEKNTYSVVIQEPQNLFSNMIIFRVKATDDDGDINEENKLKYSVIGPYREKFEKNIEKLLK
jgi:hypothetical protein